MHLRAMFVLRGQNVRTGQRISAQGIEQSGPFVLHPGRLAGRAVKRVRESLILITVSQFTLMASFKGTKPGELASIYSLCARKGEKPR